MYLSKNLPNYIRDKYIKYGKMSINDIINNVHNMNFNEKVNYIRHNYTYYNTNEDLFYKADKKTLNNRGIWLNKLIAAVIYKKYTPDVLKDFNELILRWRKGKDNNINNNHVNLTTLEIVNKEISNNKFDFWFKNNFNTFCIPNDIMCKTFIDIIYQLSLIKSYVQDSLDMIELQEFLNSSYVELLKKAKEWLNSRQPNLSNLEKNKEKVEKLAIACLVKKTKRKEELKRQKIEESYMLDKMKSYDSYKRKQQAA